VGRISGLNAGGDRGVVLALDAATGRERHRFTTPELRSDYRSVRSDGRGGLLLGNRARSGVDDLDPSTWSFRWRVSRPRNEVFPVSDLAVRDGILYVGWQDVVAIDVATGRELWSRGSRGTTASTVVCGQQVVTQHLNLSFFDRATGRLEAFNDWQDGQFPYSDLVEDGERVYAISENFAYAFPCRR
ncbi:MAG: PQQ-binding-like beta-propeller repeat protein, partial [Gemmatimonadota bacterium]